ncbi:MAG: hypothetical protein LW847_06070 [Burkholderiales bacterium]|jgi:hypothetical protein|nr:hypothetical protein [Burkholderiales bacterium]
MTIEPTQIHKLEPSRSGPSRQDRISVFVALTAALCMSAAGAATQGTLGNSSSASIAVTANAPPPPRLLQVLNLADVTLNNSLGAPTYAFTALVEGAVTNGTSFNFCVVETTGGNASLTLTSSNGGNNGDGSFRLVHAGSGSFVKYKVALTDVNASVLDARSDANGSSFITTIPGSLVRTSAAACSTDHLKLHLGFRTLPSTGYTYTDTLTIVVTPQ